MADWIQPEKLEESKAVPAVGEQSPASKRVCFSAFPAGSYQLPLTISDSWALRRRMQERARRAATRASAHGDVNLMCTPRAFKPDKLNFACTAAVRLEGTTLKPLCQPARPRLEKQQCDRPPLWCDLRAHPRHPAALLLIAASPPSKVRAIGLFRGFAGGLLLSCFSSSVVASLRAQGSVWGSSRMIPGPSTDALLFLRRPPAGLAQHDERQRSDLVMRPGAGSGAGHPTG